MLAQFLGYLILGIIQGLAEVFPVSSSAHLAITRSFLQKSFDFEEYLRNLNIGGVTFSIAIAGIVGYLAIKFLLRESLHTRSKLTYFGYYCIMAGLFFFVFSSTWTKVPPRSQDGYDESDPIYR